MKKFLTLLLAAAMTLSLAACGSKTDDNSGNNSQPASALELLNAVWANYSDDDKFPAAGGDFDEANMTEDAPGNFSVEDGDFRLKVPFSSSKIWQAPKPSRRRV